MPARLEIEGGIPLKGTVKVSAAKNAALPALAAALLTAEPLVFPNLPDLQDVRTMIRLLQTLGATIDRDGARVTVRVARVMKDEAAYELVSTMRASVLVLGPLVARHGSARVALPGGCAIGVRPIDQHLKGLARLGAEIAIENGYVVARASRLRGASIAPDMVTVTGTENLMMAAALAHASPKSRISPRSSTRWEPASAAPARRASRSRACRPSEAPLTASCPTGSKPAR